MIYRAISAPIGVQIELTSACSNNCPHCYNFQRQDDELDKTMSLEELHTTFEALEAAKIYSVTFTGGEPLLFPNLVVEGIKLCKEKEMQCAINTNLTVVSNETILRMKEAGIFSILTSIASNKESVHDIMMGRKGAFQSTVNGINLIKRHGIEFSANMVVTKVNASQVYDTGFFAHRLGAKAFSATKATPPLGCCDYSAIQPTREHIKNSLDELLRIKIDTGMSVDILQCYPLCFFEDLEKYEKFARRKCAAANITATIGPDGQVRPCSHSNRIYGNIFEEDMVSIYARMTEWRTGELLPDVCLKCTYFAQCTGGCRCEAEYIGDIHAMDPYATYPSSLCLPKRKPAKNNINNTTLISVDPSVKFREEAFGYILVTNRSFAILDKDAGVLIQKIKLKTMTFEDVINLTGADNEDIKDIKDILHYLETKQMLAFN